MIIISLVAALLLPLPKHSRGEGWVQTARRLVAEKLISDYLARASCKKREDDPGRR